MEKTVKIELKNGTEVFLADLKQGDLPQVLLNEKDGKTWLAMKSEILRTSDKAITERRLYKWNVMPALVMYDLTYGKDLTFLTEDLGEDKVYKHAVRDFIIGQDKLHNGIESKGSDPVKALDKVAQILIKHHVPEAEALKMVDEQRKALKKAGFGK